MPYAVKISFRSSLHKLKTEEYQIPGSSGYRSVLMLMATRSLDIIELTVRNDAKEMFHLRKTTT